MEETFESAMPTKDERTFAMLCHLTGFSYLLGIPGIVVPLILWLVKKDSSAFIDDQGREAVNFQIGLLVYTILCIILIFACGIGFLLLIPLGIYAFVIMIIAAIKAYDGVRYRYPLTVRLL